MMTQFNLSVFQGLVGILKITTLVLGVIIFGLIVFPYYITNVEDMEKPYQIREERELEFFYVYIAAMVLAVTLLWTFLLVIAIDNKSNYTIKADIVYHTIGAFWFIIGVIVWFIWLSKYEKITRNSTAYYVRTMKYESFGHGQKINYKITEDFYIQCIFTGLFGIINAIVYLIIALFIFMKYRKL